MCKFTPLWRLVNVLFAYITVRVHQMVMRQWHAATTTRHSYALTYQFLTDLQMFDLAWNCFEIFTFFVHLIGMGLSQHPCGGLYSAALQLYTCAICTVSNMGKRKKPAYTTQSITGYFARIGKLKFRHIVTCIN